jgi:hypothetical protein
MAKLSAIVCLGWIAASSELAAQQATAETDQEAGQAPEADLTLPPRIGDDPSPGAARLEPPAEEREDMLEAVVTGGQTDFRLPDLGTSFRKRQEERETDQRIEVQFLNLYDPENRDPAEEAFPSLEEKLGVGMLRVFRLEFGKRDRDREPE